MEYLQYIEIKLICVIFVLAITFIIKKVLKKPKPPTDQYSQNFRIVELKNGLYEVQQFRCKWDGLSSLKEWTRPEDDGMNTFHTLDEARTYKETLVAKMLEQDGFSIKRVVE